MRQFNDGPPISRAELLDALDKLCEAMKHLAQTAESKYAPSIACPHGPELVEPTQCEDFSTEFEEPNLELIGPTSNCPFSLVAEDLVVQDISEDMSGSLTPRPDLERQEAMFAGRLVELQARLGGFLK